MHIFKLKFEYIEISKLSMDQIRIFIISFPYDGQITWFKIRWKDIKIIYNFYEDHYF